jgi:hypothetical protein
MDNIIKKARNSITRGITKHHDYLKNNRIISKGLNISGKVANALGHKGVSAQLQNFGATAHNLGYGYGSIIKHIKKGHKTKKKIKGNQLGHKLHNFGVDLANEKGGSIWSDIGHHIKAGHDWVKKNKVISKVALAGVPLLTAAGHPEAAAVSGAIAAGSKALGYGLKKKKRKKKNDEEEEENNKNKGGKKKSKWILHIQATAKKYKGLKGPELFKKAKETYNK